MQGYTNDQPSFLPTPGETHRQSRLSIQSFDPPIYRTLLLSATYDGTLLAENALKIWWSAGPGNEPSSLVVPSRSLRLRCHKRRSLDYGPQLVLFLLLHYCLSTVREVSALFVSPAGGTVVIFSPVRAYPRSSRGVDLLAVRATFSPYIRAGHIFIRGRPTSFYGFSG